MKKTYQEILEVLKEKLEDIQYFAYGVNKDIGLGPITEITEARNGGEGLWSNWNRVYYFKDHDVYIKVTGYYSSYNGTDFDEGWDCCSEVRPEQKTITVYQ